jgi:c-di-AMP phosphodiesterase-like protein
VNISGIHATVSVGVGIEGASYEENFNFASMSVEMALSRGGDQAVIRDRMNFEFFGGRDAEVETRTKVKSRVVANALGSFIKDASTTYIMGHRYGDMDALGAAVGICCIARTYGKKARIVVGDQPNAFGVMANELRKHKEYEDIFITPKEAMLQANSRSLLVVVDTNRPEQVEDEALLQTISRLVVIDHHRRAASYIENAALTFYEPYASSVCELVVELLQELVEQSDILRFEAEAMMAGIVTDTKNFTMRTGERTFDAAAFLRRAGADTSTVKKLLQNDYDSTVCRYSILERAQMYRDNICLAAMERPVDRVVAAQAADEMLNISGVEASVVLYPTADGGVILSARSIGSLNVQVLLEKLGGGGNKSAAGAQMKDITIDDAMSRLKAAIDEYLS